MGLVDIHCHVLPAVDDGAPSVEVALEMLRRGREEGIDTAVLTPHIRPEDGPEKEEQHRQRFAQLQRAAAGAGVDVELHLGAEIGFRFGLAEVAAWPSGHLAGGRYVLVDLPPGPLSPSLEQGFFELRAAGYRPILAHPERHRQLARSPERIARLRALDLLVQIDAGSLTGRFGRRAREAAEDLVGRGWAEFVASDGHDLRHRPLSLAAAAERVEVLAGAVEARRLCIDNPGRVVLNGDVELRPRRERRRPRTWWSRLLEKVGGRERR